MKKYKPLFEKENPQIYTKEFKKWFGKSKVVKGGKPLVVYHGTQSDFTQFAPKRTGHGELAYNNSFYFTSEKANTSTYANANNTKGKVLAVYLSIQKPKIVDSIEDMRSSEKTAKKKGYDGIIAKGVKDGNVMSDIYIAFYPNQIKSATGNNGNFDPRSDNMLESYARDKFSKDEMIAIKYLKSLDILSREDFFQLKNLLNGNADDRTLIGWLVSLGLTRDQAGKFLYLISS